MSLIILYTATALVFLALDVVMLKRVLHPLFSKHIGHMMLDAPRMGAAGVFYLLYVAGIVFFVALPAANGGSIFQAFIAGLILGAMAYGTYEFTNFATLKGWRRRMVAIDLSWGALLTALSAVGGVWIHSIFT